jgi:hypothetical protein
MNQAEQQLFLDKCEEAFLVFAGRNPQYEQTESNARRIATELKALGLSPTNAEHIQIAWDKLKPASAPESTDPVELEARALIASGRVTLESIEGMSVSAYELAARSAVFGRCVEILSPKRAPSVLTAGEVGAALGQANLSTDNGIPATVAQKVEELEAWKRKHFESISTAPAPGQGTPQRGFTNPGRDMPLPKLTSEAQFAATIQRERADQKFLEGARDKAARVRRVKANRGNR